MKRCIYFIFLLLLLMKSFAAEKKTFVLTGRAVSDPFEMPYGMAAFFDGNRFIAISHAGKVLFTLHLPFKTETNVEKLGGDFLLVTNGTMVTLLNPLGRTLFQKDVGFTISQGSIMDVDGRVFIKGEKNIACVGLNGVIKWKIDLSLLADHPLIETEDGSLLAFLRTSGGEKAVLINAFGENLQNLEFMGDVLDFCSSENGPILVYKNGTAISASFRGKENFARTKINLSKEKILSAKLSVHNELAAVLYTNSTGTIFTAFDIKSGRIFADYAVEAQDVLSFRFNSSFLILTGKKKIYVYEHDGKKLLEKEKEADAKYFFTNAGVLLTFYPDWVMTAQNYKLKGKKLFPYEEDQNIFEKNNLNEQKICALYRPFFIHDNEKIQRALCEDKIEEIVSEEDFAPLFGEKYGEKEKKLVEKISLLTSAFLKIEKEKIGGQASNVFEKDIRNFQETLFSLRILGTSLASEYLALMIESDKKNFYINAFLFAAAENPFDVNGTLFAAIQRKILFSAQSLSENSLLLAIDVLYKSAVTMGNTKNINAAKSLFSFLLQKKFKKNVNALAREKLKLLSELF